MSFIPFFIYLFIKKISVFNIKLLGPAVMLYTPTPNPLPLN